MPGSQYDADANVDADADVGADTDAKIEMNPTPVSASASASISKDATSIEAVSLKFDTQLESRHHIVSQALHCN